MVEQAGRVGGVTRQFQPGPALDPATGRLTQDLTLTVATGAGAAATVTVRQPVPPQHRAGRPGPPDRGGPRPHQQANPAADLTQLSELTVEVTADGWVRLSGPAFTLAAARGATALAVATLSETSSVALQAGGDVVLDGSSSTSGAVAAVAGDDVLLRGQALAGSSVTATASNAATADRAGRRAGSTGCKGTWRRYSAPPSRAAPSPSRSSPTATTRAWWSHRVDAPGRRRDPCTLSAPHSRVEHSAAWSPGPPSSPSPETEWSRARPSTGPRSTWPGPGGCGLAEADGLALHRGRSCRRAGRRDRVRAGPRELVQTGTGTAPAGDNGIRITAFTAGAAVGDLAVQRVLAGAGADVTLTAQGGSATAAEAGRSTG